LIHGVCDRQGPKHIDFAIISCNGTYTKEALESDERRVYGTIWKQLGSWCLLVVLRYFSRMLLGRYIYCYDPVYVMSLSEALEVVICLRTYSGPQTFRVIITTNRSLCLLLRPRWLWLRIRDCRNQLVNDLAAGLVADVVDFLDLDVRILFRVVLGFLVA